MPHDFHLKESLLKSSNSTFQSYWFHVKNEMKGTNNTIVFCSTIQQKIHFVLLPKIYKFLRVTEREKDNSIPKI